MANFNFTIEKSRFQETKFIESLKQYLFNNSVKTQNARIKVGNNSDAYQEFENPFDYQIKMANLNILGYFYGRIKVSLIKTSKKNEENEDLIVNDFILKGDLKFKQKKIIPIIISIIGFFIAIGNGFSGGTIFSVLLFLLVWYIGLKIYGMSSLKKAEERFKKILSNYVDII